MANINDFKLLATKCRAYYDILELNLGRTLPTQSSVQKERIGFYLLMLESICDIKDISDMLSLIVDEEFNWILFNNKIEDFGIDAIFIDEDTRFINLFNFKYREKFKPDQQQSLNESFLSTKYTNCIINESTKGLQGNLKDLTKQIIDCLNGTDTWNLRLYIVSNESKELNVNSTEITQLKDLFDLETVSISLDAITKMLSIRPKPINAVLHVDKEAVFSFNESSLSSSKSFIVKLPASDLIRITCNDENSRISYQMEDFETLFNYDMEFNLLFDNVRGLVAKSKYNSNIFNTLKTEPEQFFMYNNGLTLTANDLVSQDTNGKKKLKIEITDFQVVNGGQTLRTIHKFHKEDVDHITKYLSNCELLVRIFKTQQNGTIRNKIAEYTNSQNAISNIDLKSLSAIQISIEEYLNEHDIIYARKVGDIGIAHKPYKQKISMEKLGQIVFAILGHPEKVSNQKKLIFDKYYDEVFGKNFDITKTVAYIEKYFNFKHAYDNNTKEYVNLEQKVFYLLYLDNKTGLPVNTLMDFLEATILSYPLNRTLPAARKLILAKFKDYLDKELKNLSK